jgi:hypothetical protein
MRYYRLKERQQKFFVGDVVDKNIADELWITDLRNIFVGKTLKSCRVKNKELNKGLGTY